MSVFLTLPQLPNHLYTLPNLTALLAAAALIHKSFPCCWLNLCSLHIAARRVCSLSLQRPHQRLLSEQTILRMTAAFAGPAPPTKFKLQEPLILYRRTPAAWVSAHNAGPTMWLHCPGHSAEQESDSVRASYEFIRPALLAFLSLYKYSLHPATRALLSTH